MANKPESLILENDPGSLILVSGLSGELHDSPVFGRLHGLLVADFSFLFPVAETGRVRALTAHGAQSIEHPEILPGHRYSIGSWWSTSDFSRYPNPPFLLTDDPAYRLVYHGLVLVDPTDKTAKRIRNVWGWDEPCNPPIATKHWLGVVRFLEPETNRGEFWAFANRDLRLSGRFDDLACEGEDWPREFGSITIPDDALPLDAGGI